MVKEAYTLYSIFFSLKMGKINLLILFLSLLQLQTCFGDHVGQLSTLHKVVLDGYDKGAKPDGQIKVKFGMEILRVSLCPHKEVCSLLQYLVIFSNNLLTSQACHKF